MRAAPLSPSWNNGSASFETAASRLPQDDGDLQMPSNRERHPEERRRRVSKDAQSRCSIGAEIRQSAVIDRARAGHYVAALPSGASYSRAKPSMTVTEPSARRN